MTKRTRAVSVGLPSNMVLPVDHLGLDKVERMVLMRVARPGVPLPSRRLEKARREARERLLARGLIAGTPRQLTLTVSGKRMVAAMRLTDPL